MYHHRVAWQRHHRPAAYQHASKQIRAPHAAVTSPPRIQHAHVSPRRRRVWERGKPAPPHRPVPRVSMEPASSSSTPPAAGAAARPRPPEELKLRRKTLETVLEQCQRALEMVREEDGLEEPADAADPPEEGGRDDEGAQPPPPSDADYETDELCDLLQSRVQSPEFLEKLDSIQKSVYQHGAVDEMISWDIVSAADIWDDKSMNISDDSEDGYVLVKQEDIVDGIACFMAAYLLSLKQTKDLTPNQLQKALSKTFSAKKRKSKLQKAWDGTKVVYNIASWSATAIGIYQNPAIVQAATAAFWTSCRVISKFL